MRTLYLLVAFAYVFVANAWSDNLPAGSVKTVAGEAFITTAGTQVRAAVGTPVYSGSQLKTGAKSSLGIVFNDATVMSFGADTAFTIDNYVYAPDSGQHKLASKLAKGSLGYLSGAIAKLKPESVSIQTSTGTLGIRGTKLLVIDTELQSTVTLVADPDGAVGQAVVRGAGGTQTLTQVNTSVPLNGASLPTATSVNAIQNLFGDVLTAFPPQPPLPLLGQGAGAVGVGAQPGVAAAVGGLSGSVLTFGALSAVLVIEGAKGGTGPTGTR